MAMSLSIIVPAAYQPDGDQVGSVMNLVPAGPRSQDDAQCQQRMTDEIVSERTREIGIRMALGARQLIIFRDVLVLGGSLVAIGSVLGLAGGVVLTRWIRGLLFQVSPSDPLLLAGATLGLIAVALLATLIPARRATRVNPVIALRS